jgi:hypothetical protein
MWDYLAQAHRFDLRREADARRLARLASDRPAPFARLLALRSRIVAGIQPRTVPASRPIRSTQELQPCVDAQ